MTALQPEGRDERPLGFSGDRGDSQPAEETPRVCAPALAALDPALQARIEKLLGGPLLSWRAVQGGYTPALRLVCHTATDSFFVKVGVTPLTAIFLRREIETYQTLSGLFMPTLVAHEASVLEPILVIEDLSGCVWPPPWTPRRVAQVAEQIHALHDLPVAPEQVLQLPAAPEGRQFWQQVAAAPAEFLSLGMASEAWLGRALPDLIAAEAQCRGDGDSLCHFDLRSDNMCLCGERVVFVDWNHAAMGNPRLDFGSWLPSLAFEGGPLPEQLLPDAPEVVGWLSGYFAAHAGRPPVPDAPRVRLVQRQQLSVALPWVARTLSLPPPDLL